MHSSMCMCALYTCAFEQHLCMCMCVCVIDSVYVCVTLTVVCVHVHVCVCVCVCSHVTVSKDTWRWVIIKLELFFFFFICLFTPLHLCSVFGVKFFGSARLSHPLSTFHAQWNADTKEQAEGLISQRAILQIIKYGSLCQRPKLAYKYDDVSSVADKKKIESRVP